MARKKRKIQFVRSSEISAAVGTSLALSFEALQYHLSLIAMNAELAQEYTRGSEIKTKAPEIFIRSKLARSLKVASMKFNPGSKSGKRIPAHIVSVKDLSVFNKTIADFRQRGFEKAILVTDKGSLIPSVKIETGDLIHGGLASVVMSHMVSRRFDQSFSEKSSKSYPRKISTIYDLYKEQYIGYDEHSATGTKTEAVHLLAYAGAEFSRFYALMNLSLLAQSARRIQYPNIIDPIHFAGVERTPSAQIFKRSEVIVLNNKTLRQDISRAPPCGSTYVFYCKGHTGRRELALITFEYLSSDSDMLAGLTDEQKQDVLCAEYDGKSVYCVWNDYVLEAGSSPSLVEKKLISAKDINHFVTNP